MTKLDVPSVEIAVPEDFKLSMQEAEESAPVAYLVGPGLRLQVMRPETRISSMEEEKRMLTESFPRTIFIRSDELPSGYLLVMRDVSATGQPEYATNVLRRDLHLFCGAADLTSLEDACRVASICLTLQRSPSPYRH